jgi:hypothetical protein
MLENKEYMKELRAQVIACYCSSNVRRGEYSRHCKTKKHMKYEEGAQHITKQINLEE